MRKQGDVSRRRRLIGPVAKLRWYARYRALRFARRFGFVSVFGSGSGFAGNVRNNQPRL
jgi:hypothetical protein